VQTISVFRYRLTSSVLFSGSPVDVQKPLPQCARTSAVSVVGGTITPTNPYPASPGSECLMMTTRTVPAAQLHIGDLVLPETGPARRITLHRLQGTLPVVVLAYA
jgi:hypothetical protein